LLLSQPSGPPPAPIRAHRVSQTLIRIAFDGPLLADGGDDTNWPRAETQLTFFTNSERFDAPFSWVVYADGDTDLYVTADSGTTPVGTDARVVYDPVTAPLVRGLDYAPVEPFDIPVAFT